MQSVVSTHIRIFSMFHVITYTMLLLCYCRFLYKDIDINVHI